MYIPVTDNDEPFYSEGFVVRFYKLDGTQWVANFQPGRTDFKKVYELTETTNLLVIASGTCYLMSPDTTKPLSVFGVDYVSAFEMQDGRLILQDQTDLTIIEKDGAHWDTERISCDGLKELELKGNIMTGLAYEPTNDTDEWVRFSYNIDTKELIGLSYFRPDKIKKSRWRFW